MFHGLKLNSCLVEFFIRPDMFKTFVYLVRNSSEWDIGLDMEIAELNLRFRKNIKDFISFEISLTEDPNTSGAPDFILT